MLRRGELHYASQSGGLIDPESVRPHLDEFGGGVLDLVASGVLKVPHPLTRYGGPEPYSPTEFALGVMFGSMFGPIFGSDI
jgi:hypothetical protein